MAKKISELTKTERMLLIRKVLEKSTRCSATDILRALSVQFELDPEDKSLKRNIYRDLKDFERSGEIRIDYFASSGEKIDTYDESKHKNTRAEYYLPADNESIFAGVGLLKEQNMTFVLPTKRSLHWRATTRYEMKIGYISISVRGPSGRFIHLYLPADELPLKILFARQGSPLPFSQQIVEEKFGFRTHQLFISDMSLSAPKAPDRFAHFMIETNKDNRSVTIADQNSSEGTFSKSLSEVDFEKLVAITRSDKTVPLNLLGYDTSSADWSRITASGVSAQLPVAIKAGQTLVVLHI